MFTLCVLRSRRCGKLLLRPGASHEASPNPYDPQPVAQLWPLQKDGDLCTSLMLPVPSHVSLSLCVSEQLAHLLPCSVPTKPAQKKWPSTTATITSSSCAPSDPTTCPSTANRCRDVSATVGFVSSDAKTWTHCERVVAVFFAVNVGEDCPVFDGLFEFCQLSGGGSVGKINQLFKNF